MRRFYLVWTVCVLSVVGLATDASAGPILDEVTAQLLVETSVHDETTFIIDDNRVTKRVGGVFLVFKNWYRTDVGPVISILSDYDPANSGTFVGVVISGLDFQDRNILTGLEFEFLNDEKYRNRDTGELLDANPIDLSRITFGSDFIAVNLEGLGRETDQHFDIRLITGPSRVPAPSPLLIICAGLFGFSLFKRRGTANPT